MMTGTNALQMLLQGFPLLAVYGEDVVDMVAVLNLGQTDGGIVDLRKVSCRYPLPYLSQF